MPYLIDSDVLIDISRGNKPRQGTTLVVPIGAFS